MVGQDGSDRGTRVDRERASAGAARPDGAPPERLAKVEVE